MRAKADVTVSDPYYPNGGWKNVLARPTVHLRITDSSTRHYFGKVPVLARIPELRAVLLLGGKMLSRLFDSSYLLKDFAVRARIS